MHVSPARQPLPAQQGRPAVPQLDIMHEPLTHARVMHDTPHEPQWLVVVRRSTSQPFAGLPSQSPKVPRQVRTQRPAEHVASMLAVGTQTLLHAPQWFGSVAVFTQPPLQEVAPPVQPETHMPDEHT